MKKICQYKIKFFTVFAGGILPEMVYRVK